MGVEEEGSDGAQFISGCHSPTSTTPCPLLRAKKKSWILNHLQHFGIIYRNFTRVSFLLSNFPFRSSFKRNAHKKCKVTNKGI